MKTILRTIHVGVGNRGQWPLRLATPESGFRPVALVDPDPKMLAAARELAGDVPGFVDLDEALATVRAEAAIICSPTRFHLAQGSRCLAAGLHVLVEKGMAPTLDDARQLVSAAQAAKRSLCVAQNYRYQSMERTVGRMLSDSAHPQYAGSAFLIEYTQNRQRPHPRTLDYPFASVWDMSCHHFDTLLSWLGLGFTEVTARAFGPAWSRYKFPNNTSLQITHASGCLVHYLHTHNAAFNEVHIRVQAERGTIIVDGDRVSFCPRADMQLQHESVVAVSPEPNTNELGVLADFHRHCVDGTAVGISGAANLSVMALCDATCRSVESGRTVVFG
jgi:predicted dehydrogenase